MSVTPYIFCARELNFLNSSVASNEEYTTTVFRTWSSREQLGDTTFCPEGKTRFPASGFLLIRASDPILDDLKKRSFQRTLDFLQPAQCAVVAPSSRDLMTAVALAFDSV